MPAIKPKPENLAPFVYAVRGEKVMLDADLAMLYGVETGALNRAVKRNIKRFIANDHAQTARPQRRIGLPEALDDIARLYDFVAEKNARAAQSVVTCIKAAIRQLGQFPEIGRSMADDAGPREIFAAFGAGAYVLRY